MAKKKNNKKQLKQRSGGRSSVLDKGSYEQKNMMSLAREIFRTAQKRDKNNSKISRFYSSLDFDSVRINRRIEAAVRMLEKVKSFTSSVCPEIPGTFSFEGTWFEMNANSGPAFDVLECSYKASLAAAIWVLDHLTTDAEVFDEVLEYLPTDVDSLYEFKLPDFYDLRHSEDVVRAMVSIICSRNKDCVGKHDKKEPLNVYPRVFMDLYTADNKHHQQVGSRIRFESILALIPEKEIEQATAAFEAVFWDWIDRYFQTVCVLTKEQAKINDKLERVKNTIEANCSSALSAFAKGETITNFGDVPQFPFVKPKQITDPVNSMVDALPSMESLKNIIRTKDSLTPMQAQDMKVKMDGMFSDFFALMQQQEKAFEKYDNFEFQFLRSCFAVNEEVKVSLGEEIASIWEGFEVEDPYMLCFAFLYLLDTGSDLPWLYYPSMSIMNYCSVLLPWSGGYRSVFSDGKTEDEEAFDKISPPKSLPFDFFENKTWYKLHLANKTAEPVGEKTWLNLSHVIYDLTGCLMPRNVKVNIAETDLVKNYGISDEGELSSLMQAIVMIEHARAQNFLAVPVSEFDDEEDEIFDDEESSTEYIAKLESKISSLKSELDSFKKHAYKTRKELQEEKRQRELMMQKGERDRQELVDLRELLFNQKQNLYYDEGPADNTITFPYHTKKRIVVFGGHESWVREIKHKLPDVRFVDRNMVPNTDMIRYADVVWIQANAIAHAYYYKIIDVVRKNDIPVRYFSFASAEKCAEQIVNNDAE